MAGPAGHPVISYQPLRLLFQLAYAGTVVVRLPLWFVVAFLRPLRPHPKWTAKQALMSRVAHALFDFQSRIGITQTLTLKPGKDGERFKVIEPSPSSNYTGPLESPVKPEAIGGKWYPALPDATSDFASKTVVYFAHGGAFVIGDGRDGLADFAGNNLIEGGAADMVFSLQYRLSGWAGQNPFPAALQDAVTGYLYLTRELGIPSKNIVLCGDSAGGNLMTALLRYIEEFGTQLNIGLPKCVAVVSPWVAPFDYETSKLNNYNQDFLPKSLLSWGAHTYAGDLPPSNKYITPLGNPFATSVPIYATVGTAEIFHDAVQQWAEQMKQVEGNKVVSDTVDAALHDIFLVGEIMGFVDSAKQIVAAIKDFVHSA
ncbi:hypothetical protein E8E14_006494 [Neopestalotiopsis sp. 37M]|nr:hypothetical protein E8E14_006494 [Neopestalotiopsis sp. 37M]